MNDREIIIKPHKGKKKEYYTVHLMIGREYFRLFGKFGSKPKARAKARELAERYSCSWRFLSR